MKRYNIKYVILTFVNLLILSNLSYSQSSLFMPNEFVQAYKNGTRNYDGTPGKNYFTNHSDYQIQVDFNPQTGFLQGKEQITYHNDSPDTLKKLTLRLYKNIFKKGNPRDFALNSDDINDGIKIISVQINGVDFDTKKISSYGTNAYINLPEKLLPKTKLQIDIEWEFTMPEHTDYRTGKYGKDDYFVGYWYPQIAVYDDVFGWDSNMFGGAEEFYNDHCNFNVSITVPAPYIVWASGICENYFDIFNVKYVNRIKDAQKSNNIVTILSQADYASNDILKNKTKNTWKFKAEKIPDFAFATSKNHNWDAVSLSEPDRPERVFISAVYADSSKIFHTLAHTSREIIKFYSFNKPQVFYPYQSMTVFEGGGAMEFPTMVNLGDIEQKQTFYYVTAHEIGHTYFPFFTGTNETRYAWMDEGLISFFPRFATDAIFDSCQSSSDIIKNYKNIAGSAVDLPIMVPSSIFKDFRTYRNVAYNRPAFAFLMLHNYLGDSLFYASLKEFTERWHYKHPYPYDFFYTFENVTGENLSWLWEPYFFNFAKPDLSLEKVEFSGGLKIIVKNTGGMPLPVNINVVLANGKIQKIKKDISCWKNSDICEIFIPMSQKPKKIILGNNTLPDVNNNDNLYEF